RLKRYSSSFQSRIMSRVVKAVLLKILFGYVGHGSMVTEYHSRQALSSEQTPDRSGSSPGCSWERAGSQHRWRVMGGVAGFTLIIRIRAHVPPRNAHRAYRRQSPGARRLDCYALRVDAQVNLRSSYAVRDRGALCNQDSASWYRHRFGR